MSGVNMDGRWKGPAGEGLGTSGVLEGWWPTVFTVLAASGLAAGHLHGPVTLPLSAYTSYADVTVGGLAFAAGVVVAVAVQHICIWVAMIGGPSNMYTALEASVQRLLPWPPAQAAAQLQGRTVLVTGAGRGLGRAVSLYAHGFGADVVLTDVDMGALERTVADLEAKGGRGPSAGVKSAHTLAAEKLDLSHPASCLALADSLEKQKVNIGLLVLNAGIADKDPVKGPPGSTAKRMFWVNHLGNVVVVNELLKRGVLKKGARIVLVSSSSYELGSRTEFGADGSWNALNCSGAYAQSKFVVTVWFHWLAQQLRPKGIDVVAMCPGPMNTQLGDRHVPFFMWPTFALMKEMVMKPPWQAARALLYLATQRSEYPTGSYMCVRTPRDLLPVITDPASHEWCLEHTKQYLAEVGYKLESKGPKSPKGAKGPKSPKGSKK